MIPIGLAATSYFASVFAVGFILGTIRIFLVTPRWGELGAVLLESPIMIFASWLACGTWTRLFKIRGTFASIAMGAIAFALLIMAELTLSTIGLGRSPAEFLRAFGTPAGVTGLAGQIAFGLMPLFRSAGHS